MSKKITIKWDAQDPANEGWAYSVDGGESGSIGWRAEDAIDRICEDVESLDGDWDAIMDAVGYGKGDSLTLAVGAGIVVDLAVLFAH